MISIFLAKVSADVQKYSLLLLKIDYIPAVTSRLIAHSLEPGCNPVVSILVKKLKGVGIGDGWTDPKIQGNVYG